MKKFELGLVIAERTLFWENKEEAKVSIRIGQPRPVDPDNKGTLYMCTYHIENLGCLELPVEFRGGMDSIEALQNVFVAIGETLQYAQRKTGCKLRWGDSRNPRLGFPGCDLGDK